MRLVSLRLESDTNRLVIMVATYILYSDVLRLRFVIRRIADVLHEELIAPLGLESRSVNCCLAMRTSSVNFVVDARSA